MHVARMAIREIGYEQDNFHWQRAAIDCCIHNQSSDIAQGVDAWGRLVGSEGGWAEIGYKFCDRYTLLGGWTIDNPGNGDVLDQAGARTRNQVSYIGNRFTFGRFEVGVDYLCWETDYKGYRDATNDRSSVYTQFSF